MDLTQGLNKPLSPRPPYPELSRTGVNPKCW